MANPTARTPHRSLLLAQLAALCLVAGLHLLGSYGGLYDANTWFDEIAHLAGGLWVGLSIVWAIRRFDVPMPERAAWILAATLAVGIGWEAFELVARVPKEAGYLLDTSTDLAADIMGGFLAFQIASAAFLIDGKVRKEYGEIINASPIHELPRSSA